MPARNVVKIYAPDSYYHVYNRGVDKQLVFRDLSDYEYFLSLFDRYLSHTPQRDTLGRTYPSVNNVVEILAYCLMPTHFHLLIYQKEDRALTTLFRALLTAYAMYFNRRYKRVGHLFETQVKASFVDRDPYLWHISRYIHRNPDDLPGVDYQTYPYSSYPAYIGGQVPYSWLQPSRLLSLHESEHSSYEEFCRVVP